uniref:Pentatricopeptide repeat-containing protein n=2 Tax=Tetraselmis sp. GSL018 TaxID=582737 RepID=A0A061REY1_9CHLO|eukprot:CAMPEP_0177589660 /NCGR_PEP_ID=MMETSP0419_2-20121207/6940_1 /TAXON_ID=582737 /ORGANISM="Tetraselmis sp., Strain GSL018" /LENGTH=330 /DNA_ID=CAMNT_0019080065 /DNA_START=554 /DNA_END=1546 /DNA_ORIENTATION=+
MIDDIRNTGVEPDKDTFAILARSRAAHGDVPGALQALEDAVSRHSYNPILQGLAAVGDYNSANLVYQTMKGREVEADVSTFCALFYSVSSATKRPPKISETRNGFAGGNRHWHAQAVRDFRREMRATEPLLLEWESDMQKLGLRHTDKSLEMMMQALGNIGSWRVMLERMKAGKREGLINARSYNHAIFILAKHGFLKQAQLLRRDMEAAGFKSCTVTFSGLLAGRGRIMGRQKAEGIFKEMRRSGVTPDMRIYNKMIRVCLENDDVDAAKSYLREAEGLGFAPDYFTWSVFAAEAARIGDTETMCWAVPKARASSRDPSRYVPPAEFLE